MYIRMTRLYLFTSILSIVTTSLAVGFEFLSSPSDSERKGGNCPWTGHTFLCHNKNFIKRNLYCNGINNCGDNSDEENCYYYGNTPSGKVRCDNQHRMFHHTGDLLVPLEWLCDGNSDCPNGEDERNCGTQMKTDVLNAETAHGKSLNFLYKQSKSESTTEKWGPLVDKLAVALYLSNDDFVRRQNGTRNEIAYEVSIQFLSRLSGTKLQDISSTDLASFVNAFLVSCIDPRKFHGVDIVQELRTRVDRQNYTNPYVLLSLCNAGETITESDKFKLIDTFWNKRRTFWTDMQAVAVMALACANKQQGNGVDMDTLRELTMELKQHQYRNGSVENLQTTALVMQALLAVEPDADPDNFDERRALEQIIESQKPDGSFGNLISTYFVLPILNCKSLVNISTGHCKTIRKDDETSALEDLAKRSGPKIRVQFSLWIGNEKDLERNLALRVPANLSLYAVMEIAAEIDSRYRFEYVVKNRKPYVNAISDIQDNPERGKFWFLYTVKDGEPVPAKESPADVMPKDNDHFVMWYRSGSWIE